MKKSFSIEIMRIVAAFFVIYNHTLGFWSFKNEIPGSMKYWLSMFLSVFCKFSVPVYDGWREPLCSLYESHH